MPRKKKMPEDNYILAYYQQIKNGSVTVGRWISLLYEYLVHGIEEKQFFFDQKKANTAIDWFETHCFHTEGPLAPGLIKLELWQKGFCLRSSGSLIRTACGSSGKLFWWLRGKTVNHCLLPGSGTMCSGARAATARRFSASLQNWNRLISSITIYGR